MNFKGVLFLLLVSSLLIGSACAASVNDFKVDNTYKSIYGGEYYSVYTNGNQDAGVCIYKNVMMTFMSIGKTTMPLTMLFTTREENTLMVMMIWQSAKTLTIP